MHLHHPSLSLNGKKKGKQKFRNSDEARKARDLADNWNQLLKKWGIEQQKKRKERAMSSSTLTLPTLSHRGVDQPKIPSLPFTAEPCTKPEQKVYTGSKIKGIGTMHKSNAVPIFSDEEAVDIAKMRR